MTAAWVLQPVFRQAGAVSPGRLEETCRLAESLGFAVAEARRVAVRSPNPATLFGAGFVAEIAAAGQGNEQAGPIIVDGPLSPVQQRNLERAWRRRVLDRTFVILEIFADRAKSREGRLQVEHARATYERSRLVRSWTHLERQRGGGGFLGGPGETQVEADRRALDTRLAKLDAGLRRIARERQLQRHRRFRSGLPTIALVGYTNAGKSTLFNRLCDADIDARDLLFATLDATVRRCRLPGGRPVAIADTVGFVSDLPTELIAAFRSTLHEVLEARLLLHVIDISSENWREQRQDVLHTLDAIGVPSDGSLPVFELHNKLDRLQLPERAAACASARAAGRGFAISAASGDGVDGFLERVEALLAEDRLRYRIRLAPDAAGRALAWLHEQGAVERTVAADSEETVVLAALSEVSLRQLDVRFAGSIRELRRIRPGRDSG